MLDSLKAKSLYDETNIFITSDHGFSTQTGKNSILQLLVQKGVKKSLASTDVIVSEGAIYVDNQDPEKIRAIVEVLQATEWIGAVFTKASTANDVKGDVPGTFSFESIFWNHDRAGDILTDANWSDDANDTGWKGTTLLCVSHDIAETLDFDRVLVIDDGHIVEDGKPIELAQTQSQYRDLLHAEESVMRTMWGASTWRRWTVSDGQVTEGVPA